MKILLILSIFVILSHGVLFPSGEVYGAFFDPTTSKWTVQPGSGGSAQAKLQETVLTTGWHVFDAETNDTESDYNQAFGLGFLEGALTQSLIWDSWRNWANGTVHVLSPNLKFFVETNDDWVRKMTNTNANHDPYWAQVLAILWQFEGLLAGYNQYAPAEQQLTYLELLSYQLHYELGDIQESLGESNHPNKEMSYGSHCSTLIKLTPDGNRLFSSHDTWEGYRAMLRMYKSYTTPFLTGSTKANKVSFASYPGLLMSGDDWYLTSQMLAVMETTNEILNKTLWTNIQETTVMFWIRVIVANRMATTGEEWMNIFFKYNSGTYNNQWIVVDYKLFTPSKPLLPGTLWIGEQLPGYYVMADKTSSLTEYSYWASYNIPYFDFIYNISGYPEMFSKFGNSYSYENCARAQIFRRDQHLVTDLESMKQIMRYNEWQTDPLSLHDACRSISARCDLNSPWDNNTLNEYSPFGGVDSKITYNDIISTMASVIVSGPTWDSQPPFSWTNQWPQYFHYGHPEVFAFDWVTISPAKF
jgi:hypothetical protein